MVGRRVRQGVVLFFAVHGQTDKTDHSGNGTANKMTQVTIAADTVVIICSYCFWFALVVPANPA